MSNEQGNVSSASEVCKERSDYCERVYSLEMDRKLELEKKSRFYLSLAVILTGFLSLKGGSISLLESALKTSTDLNRVVLFGVFVVLSGFILAVLLTLLFVAAVFYPRDYKKPYPRNLLAYLFSPSSKYYDPGDPRSLIDANARRFALATEISRASNEEKAKWLRRASSGSFWSIALFSLLLIGTVLVRIT